MSSNSSQQAAVLCQKRLCLLRLMVWQAIPCIPPLRPVRLRRFLQLNHMTWAAQVKAYQELMQALKGVKQVKEGHGDLASKISFLLSVGCQWRSWAVARLSCRVEWGLIYDYFVYLCVLLTLQVALMRRKWHFVCPVCCSRILWLCIMIAIDFILLHTLHDGGFAWAMPCKLLLQDLTMTLQGWFWPQSRPSSRPSQCDVMPPALQMIYSRTRTANSCRNMQTIQTEYSRLQVSDTNICDIQNCR